MSEAELFDYPIKQLPDRYGIARSAVYVRMKRLNIVPHTQGNRSYINASQLDLMDDLHDFLTEDSSRTIDDFFEKLKCCRGYAARVSSNSTPCKTTDRTA